METVTPRLTLQAMFPGQKLMPIIESPTSTPISDVNITSNSTNTSSGISPFAWIAIIGIGGFIAYLIWKANADKKKNQVHGYYIYPPIN